MNWAKLNPPSAQYRKGGFSVKLHSLSHPLLREGHRIPEVRRSGFSPSSESQQAGLRWIFTNLLSVYARTISGNPWLSVVLNMI